MRSGHPILLNDPTLLNDKVRRRLLMQKAVVLYRPLPKLLETLKKSGLSDLIKIDKDKKKDNNVTVGESK